MERDLLNDLAEVVRDVHLNIRVALDPGLLAGNGHAFPDARWIVCANFGAEAVFQRSNDLAACGVVLRIRGEHEKHVEREPQRVALNLNVPLLHDVEETHLNFAGEVGKFVDGEDAAIGPREKAVMNREFVGKVAAAASGADRVDVADDIGNGDIGGRELFNIALVARQPGDGCRVALRGDTLAARAADGAQRVVVDFATRDDRNFRVEKLNKAAQNAALGLSTQTQKDEIVPREQGIDDLGDDAVLVAMHTRE